MQGWRTGLILNMLVGNIDAVGGLMLGGAYARPQYFDVSECEYPPKRADLAQSVFFPYSNHHIAQTPHLTVQDPKAYGLAVHAGDADLLRHQPPGVDSRTRGSSSKAWPRPSTSSSTS